MATRSFPLSQTLLFPTTIEFEDKRSDSRKGAKIAKVDVNSIGKTYLKLTGMKLGYLLKFGKDMMKRGITRTVNGLPE